MPLARYDVGDPLERYPGGLGRSADAETVLVAEETSPAETAVATAASPAMTGPSPEQAMEAATALETAFGDHQFEPLSGMAPMLSLVEDIDEDDVPASPVIAGSSPAAADAAGDLLRFPGGVGPREDAPAPVEPMATQAFTMPEQLPMPSPAATSLTIDETPAAEEMPTGAQPVLVIDTDEPLAPAPEMSAASREARRRTKPRFFGIGRKKKGQEAGGDGWFTDGPRDFNWD